MIAKRGAADYLVLVKDDETRPLGVVVSLDDRRVFNLFNVHSILARGYWEEVPAGENVGEVLSLVRAADARGELKEPVLGQ